MSELYSQGTNSADGHDSADAGSETGRPSRPVNENGQENWAEDAEPLTRGEYADQVRQELAARQGDTTADRDQGHDQSFERADAGNGQDGEDLPEPRTRQEVADEARNPDAAVPHRDQAADVGLDARKPDEDQLPEPRTRQEVAEEARSGTGPLTHADEAKQSHEQNAGEWPSPEERARLRETYVNWHNEIATGPEQGTGWEQGANVVGDKPDRSPDDRRDLPPTGEQLLEPEDKGASRPERLQRRLDRKFGDVADSVKNTASSVQEILSQPQPTGHPEVPVQVGPVLGPESQHYATPDASAIAELGLVVGVLGAHFYHWASGKASARRRR
jgi:hypothetical protein